MFADQVDAFRSAGVPVFAFDLGNGRPFPTTVARHHILYRGWMMNRGEYERWVARVTAADATPFTTLDEYLIAHHLPNWFPLVKEFTADTVTVGSASELTATMAALNWPGYFVKDYVKSLKTSRGSIAHTPDDLAAIVDEMAKYRGQIEGGICLRRVEHFVNGSETRYFVIRGLVYAPGDEYSTPSVVEYAAKHVPSPFFSVDVATTFAGDIRIVEIGDGQVSDIVGWTADRFVSSITHS